MKRREFIALLSGAATWPLAARAQQPSGMRRIGVLLGNAESDAQGQAGLAKFNKALQDLGWIVRAQTSLFKTCRINWRFFEVIPSFRYCSRAARLSSNSLSCSVVRQPDERATATSFLARSIVEVFGLSPFCAHSLSRTR